jgi:hypothetical protein
MKSVNGMSNLTRKVNKGLFGRKNNPLIKKRGFWNVGVTFTPINYTGELEFLLEKQLTTASVLNAGR